MRRELGDERGRYGRSSFREQLDDVISWPANHRFATGVILVVIAGALLLSATRGLATDPRDLGVGDCLFVPTAAAHDPVSTRPIGEPAVVEGVVLDGGAERTACTASHGHEVAAIVIRPEPSIVAGALPGLLDRDAVYRQTQPLCEAAFAGYVGRALAGSAYVTFPVVPEPDAWLAGGRRTICLVAREDGQWLDHPARASAE